MPLLASTYEKREFSTHARGERRKGYIMKVVRTRIVIALASSAVLAGGLGLTGLAVGFAGSSGGATIAAGTAVPQLVCPNATLIEAGKCVPK
jgi:hypothetical protein